MESQPQNPEFRYNPMHLQDDSHEMSSLIKLLKIDLLEILLEIF